ncbi:hypothetical protein [Roseomonas chloroacetimidivorans]|uniref:hypothetical protein n=1 Tax=Roseomonas chloroacetimidivorans TaxID=1766656 RepID=UPI003C734BDE
MSDRRAAFPATAWRLAVRRARALGVGRLSGGFGPEELERFGVARGYEDPADPLKRIDEVGGRVKA